MQTKTMKYYLYTLGNLKLKTDDTTNWQDQEGVMNNYTFLDCKIQLGSL